MLSLFCVENSQNKEKPLNELVSTFEWYCILNNVYFQLFVCIVRANLSIVKELGDCAAQGRTYGNLGNTHYLLGDFQNAVASHEQVITI
jgi:hypothetical protein